MGSCGTLNSLRYTEFFAVHWILCGTLTTLRYKVYADLNKQTKVLCCWTNKQTKKPEIFPNQYMYSSKIPSVWKCLRQLWSNVVVVRQLFRVRTYLHLLRACAEARCSTLHLHQLPRFCSAKCGVLSSLQAPTSGWIPSAIAPKLAALNIDPAKVRTTADAFAFKSLLGQSTIQHTPRAHCSNLCVQQH